MKTRLLLVLVAVGLLATACNSGGSDDGVASLETTETTAVAAETDGADETPAGDDAVEVDAETAMLEFAACLRENGVDIEDPTVDASGNVQFGGFGGEEDRPDRETMQAAREACEDELGGVALGFGGRGEFDITELQDTMVEFAACMRDNGYDMDDPDLSNFGPGAGGGGGPFGDIDPDDPDYVAAEAVCGDILGGLPNGGPGRRGGGNG